MSDVAVPFGDNPSDTATLLLAAAESHDLQPEVVRTTSDGFLAPEEVVKSAGLHSVKEDPEPETDKDSEPDKPKTRRRTPRSDS